MPNIPADKRVHLGTGMATNDCCTNGSCWCWAEDRAKREQQSTAPTSKEDLTAVYDAFGIGSAVRTPAVLLANIENVKRRSECLSAIEREFFTSTIEDDDGEPSDECPLSWGAEPAQYVEQFREALKAFDFAQKTSLKLPECPVLHDMDEFGRCRQCNFVQPPL